MPDHEVKVPVDGEAIVRRIHLAIKIMKMVQEAYEEPTWVAKCDAIIAQMEELLTMITL